MKNQNLYQRFLYSVQGLKSAWGTEKSFRSQVIMAIIIIPTITYMKASPEWWGIFLLIIGATLSAELFNTAIEYLCDHVHPDHHPQIGKVKDCAAAAVLLLSLTSVLIFLAFLIEKL